MKTVIRLVTVSLASMGVLAGCGGSSGSPMGSSPPPPPPPPPTELVWDQGNWDELDWQ